VERTDLPQSWEFSPTRGRISFKTGTSFGLRDAWCVGYNPDYTVGVWLGNVDCKGSSELIGIKVAAPVVIEIFNYLTRYSDPWFKKPENVQERKVCSISGEVAGPYCKNTVTDYYIPGISSNYTCSVHHQLFIRKSDGLEVCRYCMKELPDAYTTRIVEIWPPDVASYLRTHGEKSDNIPRHNPNCYAMDNRNNLKIKSPIPNGYYSINDSLSAGIQKILLKVQSETSSEKVYWFMDDKLLALGSVDEEFHINVGKGEHTITVMNTRGQYDTVKVKVKNSNN
jgi:penicillin-binding protein 1C